MWYFVIASSKGRDSGLTQIYENLTLWKQFIMHLFNLEQEYNFGHMLNKYSLCSKQLKYCFAFSLKYPGYEGNTLFKND